MKKMIIVLVFAGMFLVGCSKEELNKLKLENANLRSEKAKVELQLNKVTVERDSVKVKYDRIMEQLKVLTGTVPEMK